MPEDMTDEVSKYYMHVGAGRVLADLSALKYGYPPPYPEFVPQVRQVMRYMLRWSIAVTCSIACSAIVGFISVTAVAIACHLGYWAYVGPAFAGACLAGIAARLACDLLTRSLARSRPPF